MDLFPEAEPATMSTRASVAVVLVNWNGWRDTIECLTSLLPTLSPGDRVIVCDNASTDGSLGHIRNWANGSGQFQCATGEERGKTRWTEYSRSETELGGSVDDPILMLVPTGGNLGFAAANNIGMRYALARGYDYVWLLNNDTVVTSSSLSALLLRMQRDPDIGICGSTLVYFGQPDTVQALGGASFDFSRGVSHHLGLGERCDARRDVNVVEDSMDYVAGASMMVTRRFLETVGLMCDDYFLYFEEIDWAIRARGSFKLAWAPESLVLHKEGASIGSSHRSRPSAISLHYLYRNRLRFTIRHVPQFRWSVLRSMLFDAAVYLKRRDWQAAGIIFRACLAMHLRRLSKVEAMAPSVTTHFRQT